MTTPRSKLSGGNRIDFPVSNRHNFFQNNEPRLFRIKFLAEQHG
jgi:hypothetical protein